MIAGRRVLVVEDEFLVAAMLEDELRDRGIIVVGPVGTLGEALALVGEAACDLAVIDWNLDGTSSEPLARALRAAGTPFVISTGYGAVPAEFSGCKVIAKPYDPEDLVAILRGLPGAS